MEKSGEIYEEIPPKSKKYIDIYEMFSEVSPKTQQNLSASRELPLTPDQAKCKNQHFHDALDLKATNSVGNDEDTYVDNSSTSLRANGDIYEDAFVTNSLEVPLNTYEDNPSYVAKDNIKVMHFKENCMVELRKALTELPSSDATDYNTSVSQNASADIEKSTVINTPKCDKLDHFQVSKVNTILKPFSETASLFIQESTQIIIDKTLTNILHSKFTNTKFCFAHTSFNNLALLHEDYIKKLGDPRGEKWFYAAKVSSVQMERILSESGVKGSFYIYESTNSKNLTPFNLSLKTSDKLEIIHYHIHKTEADEYYIKNNDKIAKFRNIHTLVQYYKLNRGNIACKLKWSPMELQEYKPMFPLDCAINGNRLHIGVSESNSTRQDRSKILKGKYNDQMVIVKTTSSAVPSKLDEDDLLNEARILHNIKHDSIRELVGVCFVNKRPYLVLGCADLQNLHEYIKNNKTKTKVVLEIFIQLASALVYLCDKRFIIHRDIAARNCLVDSTDSEGVRVKLTDFGMAIKVIQFDEYNDDSDDRCSIRWAAPEIIKERVYSTKSDVWALGVVFWEISSGGKMPYNTLNSNTEVAATIVHEKRIHQMLKPSKEKHSKIFEHIIKHCLAYKREDRYSARDIFQLSQEYLGKLCNKGRFEPIYGALPKDFSQLKHYSEVEMSAQYYNG